MADNAVQPIIIKRVKKGYHIGHHGGAWKVAYADFVTAMMAFFLMLWLLNAATEEQLKGIADYFTPTAASQSRSGSGGMLGGLAISKFGSRQAPAGPPAITVAPLPPTADEQQKDEDGKPAGNAEEAAEPIEDPVDRESTAAATAETREEIAARLEAERFEQATEALKQAIEAVPELQELANSLLVDQTNEGLRIQLVDQENLAMFKLGSSKMESHTRRLLEQIVKVVKSLPNKLSVTGHTDAKPYAAGLGYGNWELSTDRANSSRRTLIELGLPTDRIEEVAGKAARDLLVPLEPESPRNRRISIVLLREGHDVAKSGEPKTLGNRVKGNGETLPATHRRTDADDSGSITPVVKPNPFVATQRTP